MEAKITILGLYNWDNSLFDLLSLPNGVDKDSVISSILSECSDLEMLYPNPIVMKNLIGLWSAAEQYTWKTLYDTTQFEYNPIDNYDRTETRTLKSKANGTSKDGGQDTGTSTENQNGNSSNLNQVRAFDTANNTFTDREKDTVNNQNNRTTSNTTNYGHTNENTYNKDDEETIRARGNIGTVTTQAMIEAERKIADFSFYNAVADSFKKRFCLLVY